MSKETGGAAFPVTETDRSGQIAPTQTGMTLRDYFAAKAMAAILSSDKLMGTIMKIKDDGDDDFDVAKYAYLEADAMLKERDK